ncbi:hypothetical protein Lal_00041547 [Lupinus albus]|nr:hypothetical protein Lal_00041547 [Lupinus albus]
MGGHGGLNILPQKRWNVYRYDNREKVRRDEEEAAKEEQIKRNQSRKRDAEFRLERLRASKGIAPLIEAEVQSNEQEVHVNETEHVSISSPNSGHINLFEGIKIFDPIREPQKDESGEKERKKMKKMKKEEVVVTPEDEKYRFGYSYLGKQVKLPWYLEKRNDDDDDDGGESSGKGEKSEKNKRGKKTLEELREERLKREKVEKERERALIHGKQKSDRVPFGSSRFYSSMCSDVVVLRSDGGRIIMIRSHTAVVAMIEANVLDFFNIVFNIWYCTLFSPLNLFPCNVSCMLASLLRSLQQIYKQLLQNYIPYLPLS